MIFMCDMAHLRQSSKSSLSLNQHSSPWRMEKCREHCNILVLFLASTSHLNACLSSPTFLPHSLHLPPFSSSSSLFLPLFRSEQGEHSGVRRSNKQCRTKLRLSVYGFSPQLGHSVPLSVPRCVRTSIHSYIDGTAHAHTHRGAVNATAHTG